MHDLQSCWEFLIINLQGCAHRFPFLSCFMRANFSKLSYLFRPHIFDARLVDRTRSKLYLNIYISLYFSFSIYVQLVINIGIIIV